MTLQIDSIISLLLIFTRAGALFLAVPMIGGMAVPVQVRVAIGLLVAIILLPVAPAAAVGLNPPAVIVAMLFELLVGVLMGMAIQTVFATVEFASETIGSEIGLMRSQALNPMSEGQHGGEIGTLLFMLSLMIFLAMGMHHQVIAALARSFTALPAGSLITRGFSMNSLIYVTGQIFVVGTLMAAPFIAVNFLINMTFALLGKVAPKMNVFMTSFSFRILAGFVALTTTATLLAHYIYTQLEQVPVNMFNNLLGR